jgi:hypothetical protein
MFKKKLPIKRVVIAGCRDYDNYDEANQGNKINDRLCKGI